MPDIIESTLRLRRTDDFIETWTLSTGELSALGAGDTLRLDIVDGDDVVISAASGAADTSTTGISGLNIATGAFQVSILRAAIAGLAGDADEPRRIWHRFYQIYSDGKVRRIRHGAVDVRP